MRWLLVLVLLFLPHPATTAAPQPVVVLSINGAIGPATADYVHRGIESAAKQKAQLVVLRMDTPGGLDTSMRAIIKDILASPVPVAAFVAPSGARAASAGTYILMASHVAAMAPGTNLGAATPVQLGGPPTPPPEKAKSDKNADKGEAAGGMALDMHRKQLHDAAAYIRGLAQVRGRNVEWAEQAVREAVSLSAEEALANRVIDLIAADVPQLLEKRGIKGATVVELNPDWRTRFLSVITDPTIAYTLMLLGV